MSALNLASKTAALPAILTSYDFLKTAALVLMIIDHVGYFFYPDDMWLRAVGRLSAPIWFFLIGYAKSRDVGLRMWIAVIVLLLSNWVTGYMMLPVSIIGTMIAFRLALDPLMTAIARKPSALYPVVALLFIVAWPSAVLLEYGTTCMLIVMAGYMTRNRESLPFDKTDYFLFCFVAAFVHIIYQVKFFFVFEPAQEILVAAGIVAVMALLTQFRPYTYPELTAKIPAPVAGLLRLCGRWSLEIYVLHLLAFKIIAIATGHMTVHYFNFHMF